jgi:hypothetical protein
MENEKKKSGSSIGGVVFVGCMFLGAGLGMLNNDTQTGGAIGMGVGFIAMGAIWAFYRNKDL